jgi:outer membrane cobalamin receptor
MRIIFSVLILIIHSATFNLFGSDTLEAKAKREIVVEAERIKFYRSNYMSLSAFKKEDFTKYSFKSTSEALSYFPGILIRDYGGIGGIKTVSLRGLSSNDVGILIDGCKINNQQNGLVDLTLLPLEAFDEIELYKGGSSFLYSNNTSAGVINLNLNTNNDNSIRISYGSFNQVKLNSNLVFRTGLSNSLNLGIQYYYSDGDFPFSMIEFGKEVPKRRENNKISTFSVILKNQIDFSRMNNQINLFFTRSTRGVPGAVLQNKLENEFAKLTDNLLFANIRTYPYFLDSNLQSLFKFTILQTEYYDPETIPLFIGKETAHYLNKDLEFKFLYSNNLFGIASHFLAELNYAMLNGDMLEKDINSSPERKNFALGINLEKSLNSSSFLYSFEITARADFISNYSPNFSNTFGLYFKDTITKLGLKLNLANNFRLPTFNEMYFLNYGNKNLLPEKTHSINFELNYSFLSYLQPSITVFYYSTKNKIVSIPKSPLKWTAMNIAKTISYGFELNISSKIRFFDAILSIAQLNAIDKTENSPTYNKQLIYTPKYTASLLLFFQLPHNYSFSSKSTYIEKRFALPDNSYNSALKEYLLLDLTFGKEFTLHNFSIFVSFEISNLLNNQYEVILNYPMPGRYFLLNLKINPTRKNAKI